MVVPVTPGYIAPLAALNSAYSTSATLVPQYPEDLRLELSQCLSHAWYVVRPATNVACSNETSVS
jgi:hypothetical protein